MAVTLKPWPSKSWGGDKTSEGEGAGIHLGYDRVEYAGSEVQLFNSSILSTRTLAQSSAFLVVPGPSAR